MNASFRKKIVFFSYGSLVSSRRKQVYDTMTIRDLSLELYYTWLGNENDNEQITFFFIFHLGHRLLFFFTNDLSRLDLSHDGLSILSRPSCAQNSTRRLCDGGRGFQDWVHTTILHATVFDGFVWLKQAMGCRLSLMTFLCGIIAVKNRDGHLLQACRIFICWVLGRMNNKLDSI